jgi:drug/metabolite transporter (DMT)-like permease
MSAPEPAAFDPDTSPRQRVWVVVVLAAAITAISSSGVLVRGMHGADALAIAAYRTLGAAILLSPSLRRGVARLERADQLALVAAGVALALHFWTWFASLALTTVLRSTLLVCTVPAFTAVLEWIWFGRRPGAGYFVGLAVALPGVALLAGDQGRGSIAGDALALVAAVLWAVYFLLGRGVRQRLDVGATMTLVCAVAAAVLFPLALVTGTPLGGWPPTTWALIGLAVLGPQLVCHLGLVYAVRWLPASVVSGVTLLEPVGSAVLAAMVLGEVPGPAAIAGAALVLAGTAQLTRG